MTRNEAFIHLVAGVLSNPNCVTWTPIQVISRALDVEAELPDMEPDNTIVSVNWPNSSKESVKVTEPPPDTRNYKEIVKVTEPPPDTRT